MSLSQAAYILDPGKWAEDSFSLNLYPWQKKALLSNARQSIWNIHRQGGKSSLAATKALHKALFKPGSLTLVVSPSERQSGELYRKFLNYYDRLENPPGMPEDKALSCTLENSSRVVALPGIEDTVRCYSNVSLIIEDEASRVHDDLHAAIRPMLAISQGELVLMSTPRGQRGHFFKIWTEGGPSWDKLEIPVEMCSNITQEFLEEERRVLGPWLFEQEYHCRFVQTEDQYFSDQTIRMMFDDPSIAPLWPESVAQNPENQDWTRSVFDSSIKTLEQQMSEAEAEEAGDTNQ